MPHYQIPLEERINSPDSSSSNSSSSGADAIEYFQQPPDNILYNENDLHENDYNDYNPNQPYLFPVMLPAPIDPTLDQLLKRIYQRDDIYNLESVKIRVITTQTSLSQISVLLPNLFKLDLNGSVLNSLRDLGYGLNNLTYLNISSCGLTSLDGTSGMTNIKELVADGNLIQLIGSISTLKLLNKVSLKDNKIQELSALTFLQLCPELLCINLEGNPVCKLILYRNTMERVAKKLEILDGKPFKDFQMIEIIETDEGSIMSSNDQFSSFDSNSVSSENNAQNELVSQKSNGSPIVGTVLEFARQKRRQGSNSASDTISSSSSFSDL